METHQGVIERYSKFLPVTAKTPVVSLHEGSTPLVRAPNLVEKLNAKNAEIYLKLEGLNPTSSFKDRGMTVAVSKALEENSKGIIVASTGNTSASAAAYAAKAGLRCVVLIPKGAVALGKLSQALIHAAEVIAVDGNFDEALDIVKKISASYPLTVVNSINPYRIEGQKTAAFEIVDSLGDAPDYHFIPVGNAGNITAYWKGYGEYKNRESSTKLPRMMGFQAAGAAPIVRGEPVKNPKTIATAIKIGNPASWKGAVTARDESGGVIDSVTDEEILEAYKLLAQCEGVFAEPASAASVAGLFKYVTSGKLDVNSRSIKIVCTITGHGLKDPDRALATVSQPEVVPPDIEAVVKALKL